jgi:hypothetical protein
MSKILFGTDPESAVLDFNGNIVLPYFFRNDLEVPYDKNPEDPRHPIFLKEKNFKIHEDGAAFEFAVMPSHNPRELFDLVHSAAQKFEDEILSKFTDYCVPKLQFLPTVGYEVERWRNAGPEAQWAGRFGCDPQQDVCHLEREDREIDATEWPWRYMGGHTHVSGSKFIEEDPHMAVYCLMLTAGNAAIAFSDVPDLEKARTFRYGIPGNFRVQNYGENNPFGSDYQYGIEYRTPSATWLKSWEIAEPFLQWAEIGVNILLEQGLGQELLPVIREETINSILEANREKSKELLSYISSKI